MDEYLERHDPVKKFVYQRRHLKNFDLPKKKKTFYGFKSIYKFPHYTCYKRDDLYFKYKHDLETKRSSSTVHVNLMWTICFVYSTKMSLTLRSSTFFDLLVFFLNKALFTWDTIMMRELSIFEIKMKCFLEVNWFTNDFQNDKRKYLNNLPGVLKRCA